MRWYPLRFDPVYKDYLWGGEKIATKYARKPPRGTCAESWEVSDRDEGMSVVVNGPLQGRSLADLTKSYPQEILGSAIASKDRFPLLIKLIDSHQKLSVQVHPSNENAERTGGEPKTEMWYLLEADPDAEVVAGLVPGTDEQSLRDALRKGEVQRLLNRVPVETGDAVYMPGGRVHTICEGCLIMEVQQNSDTTYRLYDWDRLGTDGKPRQLHVEEAMQVIEWEDNQDVKPEQRLLESRGKNELWSVVESPCFVVDRLVLREMQTFRDTGKHFRVLFCAAGSACLNSNGDSMELAAGDTVFLPAALKNHSLSPASPDCVLLRIATACEV